MGLASSKDAGYLCNDFVFNDGADDDEWRSQIQAIQSQCIGGTPQLFEFVAG
jgi:hypothetical protein